MLTLYVSIDTRCKHPWSVLSSDKLNQTTTILAEIQPNCKNSPWRPIQG